MKKTITILFTLLFSSAIIAQIPNIREKKIRKPKTTKYKSDETVIDTDGDGIYDTDDPFPDGSLPPFEIKHKNLDEVYSNIQYVNKALSDSTSIKRDSILSVKEHLLSVIENYDFDNNTKEWMPKEESYIDNIDTSHPHFYDYYVKRKEEAEKALRKFIEDSENEEDLDELKELYREIEEEEKLIKEYDEIISAIVNPNWLLPTLNSSSKALTFDLLYSEDTNKFNLVNSASFQINNNGGIVKSELVSAFLGPSRVSFGSMITNKSEDSESGDTETQTDQTEAFQRLLAGGGNVYLDFELPLLLAQGSHYLFYFSTSAHFGLEVAEFSGDIDKSTGNGNLNLNLYTSLSTDENEFAFFGNINYGLYFGPDDFYNRLNIIDEKPFWFGEITAGFTIQSNLRFALTFNTFGSEENLNSGNVLIGAQILSDIFNKKE